MTKGKTKSDGQKQTILTHLTEKTKKYGAKDPHQVTITKKLVSFVARDYVPLSIVDGHGFQYQAGSGGSKGGPGRARPTQSLFNQNFFNS